MLPPRSLIVVLSLLLGSACTKSNGAAESAGKAGAEKKKTETKTAPEPASDAAAPTPASDAVAPTPTPDAKGGATKTVPIEAKKPPEVTLLEPGDEPRQELRFHPAVGVAEGLRMTMSMSMGASGAVPATRLPDMIAIGSAEVSSIDGDRLDVVQTLSKMEVRDDGTSPAPVVKALRDALAGFESYQARVQIDSRGVLYGGEADIPQSLPPQMEKMLDQMTQNFAQIQIPLPSEPVGKGGRWTAVSHIDQAGVKLEQTATYTVVDLEGTVVDVEIEVDQALREKTFSPPGAMGATATINRFDSGGKGTMKMDLTHLVPDRSELSLKTSMDLSIELMGQQQEQSMDMDLTMVFERTDAG